MKITLSDWIPVFALPALAIFAAAFILAPLVLLFHPPSIENCMLPFMKALGAVR
jgi:hypothetical protein